MLDAGQTVRRAHPLGMALIVGLSGCGEVLGIDDWQQTGAGGAGGAGGTTANAATGQGGAQTSSTASGMPGSEVCDNAADDDADGLVDCADSDCVGYTCTPAVPPNWIGPVAVALGMPGDALPPCGPEWTGETDFFAGTLTAPAAQCSACDCAAPDGGQCTLSGAHFSFYTDLACNSAGGTTQLQPNQCTLASSTPGSSVMAYRVSAQASLSGGACAASGGVATIQPASFDKVARICESPVSGGGCGTDKGCVPPPPPSFRASLCIYRQVNDEVNPTCPPGYNPLSMLYKNIADTRGCSACNCGAPMGQSCKPTAYVYSTATCTGGIPQTLDYCNGLPNPLPSASMRVKVDPGVPLDGSCNPSLVTAMGEATGTSRTLACCLP